MMQLQWNTVIVWLNKSYFINYMHRSKLYLYVSRGNKAILSLLEMHNEMTPFILHDVSRDCVVIIHNHHTVFVYNIFRVICDTCGLILYISSRLDAYVLFYNIRSQLGTKMHNLQCYSNFKLDFVSVSTFSVLPVTSTNFVSRLQQKHLFQVFISLNKQWVQHGHIFFQCCKFHHLQSMHVDVSKIDCQMHV